MAININVNYYWCSILRFSFSHITVYDYRLSLHASTNCKECNQAEVVGFHSLTKNVPFHPRLYSVEGYNNQICGSLKQWFPKWVPLPPRDVGDNEGGAISKLGDWGTLSELGNLQENNNKQKNKQYKIDVCKQTEGALTLAGC